MYVKEFVKKLQTTPKTLHSQQRISFFFSPTHTTGVDEVFTTYGWFALFCHIENGGIDQHPISSQWARVKGLVQGLQTGLPQGSVDSTEGNYP